MDSWKRRARRALLVALALHSATTWAIWPFPSKRFSKNGLVSAGSLGFEDNGRVIAFGDFNADQFLDAVFLDVTQKELSIYLWDHEAFRFKKSSTLSHPTRIYNVVPGDMTYDGKLDLLVMSAGESKEISMTVYLGPFDAKRESPRIDVASSTLVQPIPIDANGDMRIDFLGVRADADGTSLKLWQNSWNESQPGSDLFKVTDPKLVGATCQLANPHSNAVVDLNGDCLADLFLVCEEPGSHARSYQMWVNMKDQGFGLVQSGPLPDGVGAISFADMDRDGTIDLVFPTCKSIDSSGVGTDCHINIAYNQQLPLCKTATEKNCRPAEHLCSADPHFAFDLHARPDNKALLSIPLADLVGSSSAGLLMRDDSFDPSLPVALKVGDINLDGFPDIVPIVVSTGNKRTPKILLSEGGRALELVKDDVEPLDVIEDARSVALIDLDEDGTLDLLVQRTGKEKVSFIQNNFFFDAFFLRAIVVLNGACGGWCEGNNTKYHPFGVSYSGATYKYTVLDTSGVRSAAQVGQLPQTAYQALLTPYAFFGLGRTNNYIENLFVGSTRHDEQHYINMEGVIPNSKVVIIPPRSGSGDMWRKELYLRPGNWIPWVGVSVIAAMIGLAATTFVLHLNEKREDELERRRASHHINFDAL
ncbi:hypothetical protein AURDEDRAFT_63627 [Auricularia subglabra TFB-10046 SS5]|nr:hypothetical protein AURDEDRAFT_63627 [Auricularia subglabra TFB-10046 SS5]